MKVLKRFAGLILAVCLMVPMLGTVVFAAEGVLMYSDPSTKVGENVDIDLVVQSSSGETVGDVQVEMSYDPESLEFVSGEGFTADGSGTLSFTGTGSGAELRETMTFRALKTGEARITVNSSTAALASGETLNLTQGSSTVTVDAADDGTTSVEPSSSETAGETTDIVVSVNGTDYNFSEAFTSADIPEGFSETTLAFNGEDRTFVANEAGVTLGYLVDASGTGSFFLYNSDDATFAPYIELNISDTTTIVPLSQADAVSLPENYQQVELTVQEQQYPAWSDPANDRYYVIYALNTRTGASSLYQYDTEDGTYQYFEAPAQTDETGTGTALPGRLGELIGDHLMVVMIIVAIIVLILLILMIVFAVKLVHRNQELDDLYDEYDIPFDDEEDEKDQESKKNRKSADETDYDDDDYDDDYDDDDDDYDDDYNEPVNSRGKKNKKEKKGDSSDDYNIDFVDL